MRHARVACLLFALGGCTARPGARPVPDAGPTPIAARDLRRPADRAAIAADVRRSLRLELLAPWYPRAVDADSGGFLSSFDQDWQPTGTQEKMVVSQARHVWTAARAAEFFPAERATFLPIAAHGARFLREVMWDREQGGFYWLVTRGGTPRREPGGRLVKQTYGNVFAIHALAAYHDVSRDTAALRLAQDGFRWLDAHAHDPQHGGYFNFMERDGRPLPGGYGSDAPKDHNSSIHVLEAFTELYRVWPDPVLRERVLEVLALVRDRIRVDPGYLTLFHTADWRPVSWRDSSEAARRADRYVHDHVSFGHDVGTAYLMLEASHALGLRNDTTTRRAARQMVDHALRNGWDEAAGGFYEAGYYYRDRPGHTLVDSTKSWWAQAEGLNALLLLADMFPADSMRYEERFLRQWAYVTANLIDHERGGWYERGLDREPERRQGPKGHLGKATYHEARALMNVARRLEGRGVPPAR